MLPKKYSFSKRSKNKVNVQSQRADETHKERDVRLSVKRSRASTSRAAEAQVQRDERLERERVRLRRAVAAKTPDQRNLHVDYEHQYLELLRRPINVIHVLEENGPNNQDQEQRNVRLEGERLQPSTSRAAGTPYQCDERSQSLRSRTEETPDQRNVRLEGERLGASTFRATEDKMVKHLTLSMSSRSRSNISVNCGRESMDSPTTPAENDAIAFQEVPLTALSKKTLRKLSHLLNSKKILRSEEGYERDWRGLACLAKQKCLCDEKAISLEDPITKVVQLWCANNPKTATFAYLEKFLGIIERWDVSDDIYENLVEDTKIYQMKQLNDLDFKSNENVSEANNFNGNFGHGSDPNILTTADVIRAQKGLPPQTYDAFVLYADADLNYASEMLTKLEDSPEFSFKLCIKDRDLLAGVQFEHVALTQLIEERCKHLIVILTEEFLKSPENKFLVNYTQALQIQHKTRKIIPLLYEDSVNIPRTLKIYTHLRYNSSTACLFNFWSKLANSIRNVNAPTDTTKPTLSGVTTFGNSLKNIVIQTKEERELNILQTPTNQIPSISVIPAEDNDQPKKKDNSKFKPLTVRKATNEILLNDGMVLRNAHSTGQLHTSHRANNAISMSDLSTTSTSSDIKKKKKWSSKILKKVFTRSNSKLQEA